MFVSMVIGRPILVDVFIVVYDVAWTYAIFTGLFISLQQYVKKKHFALGNNVIYTFRGSLD